LRDLTTSKPPVRRRTGFANLLLSRNSTHSSSDTAGAEHPVQLVGVDDKLTRRPVFLVARAPFADFLDYCAGRSPPAA
jgi:hypothetical protein